MFSKVCSSGSAVAVESNEAKLEPKSGAVDVDEDLSTILQARGTIRHAPLTICGGFEQNSDQQDFSKNLPAKHDGRTSMNTVGWDDTVTTSDTNSDAENAGLGDVPNSTVSDMLLRMTDSFFLNT